MNWDNFSCVDMQRKIRSRIAEERGTMSIVEYLRKRASQNNAENSESLSPLMKPEFPLSKNEYEMNLLVAPVQNVKN